MARISNRGAQLFCLLFVVIGVIVVVVGIHLMSQSFRAEHWPVTGGVVRLAKMTSHSSDHGSRTYSAEVTYAYQVGGVNYTCDKISIGQMSASSEYAQGILNRYPVGRPVSVHYAPDDPSEAVLETGIHGGTWICLAVGTVFTLFGIMFLQIQRAAARAQMSGAPQSLSTAGRTGGGVVIGKPPVLMGVIFLLTGIGVCFVPADPSKPGWIMYAAGAVFVCGGIMLLLMRLENKVYCKIAGFVFLMPFLAVFHWVSFGPGDRTGTATSLFSTSHDVNVRVPFAIFTILLDVAILAGLFYWLFKRRPN